MSKHKKADNNQLSLFTPVISQMVPAKDQQDIMQYPFFSLSKRKRTTPIEYDDGNVYIKVLGTEEKGIANIFDADVLIFIASQLMEAINKNQPTSPEIRVSKYQLLEFVGKATGGKSYQQLEKSLDRLQETSIETSIRQDGQRKRWKFSWIADWMAVEHEHTGKPIAIRFRINEWIYKSIIEEKLVLTIDRKYFELEGGIERFLYRLARKVAGRDSVLCMKMKSLHKRSGSPEKPKKFRDSVVQAIFKGKIPEYHFKIIEESIEKEEWIFASRKKWDNELILSYIYSLKQKPEYAQALRKVHRSRSGNK